MSTRVFTNKFENVTCARCGQKIAVGAPISWDRKAVRGKRSWHISCPTSYSPEAYKPTESEASKETCPICMWDKDQCNCAKPIETPKPTTNEVKPKKEKPTMADSLTQTIVDAILPLMHEQFQPKTADSIDENKVAELIRKHGTLRIDVVRLDDNKEITVEMGVQHFRFPLLLATIGARQASGHGLNIWLYGPAGTGKTTGAEMVGKALGARAVVVLPKLSESYTFFGYHSPGTGEYKRTPARDVWEFGGILVMDDFDGTDPNVATELMAPLANGTCMFPDGMVPRHKDCVIILTANTIGSGATTEYVGRLKQDAAFLDRFAMLQWPIDEKLELATAGNEVWVKRVQSVRAKVSRQGLKVMITPRASYYGAALLNAGIAQSDVEEMVLRKGMTADQWSTVC